VLATPGPNYFSGPPADDPDAVGALEWAAASLPADERVARGWDAVYAARSRAGETWV